MIVEFKVMGSSSQEIELRAREHLIRFGGGGTINEIRAQPLTRRRDNDEILLWEADVTAWVPSGSRRVTAAEPL